MIARSQLRPGSFPLYPMQSGHELFEMEHFEYSESEINRSSPDYIRWVQESLNKVLGLNLKLDGVIGPQTRCAILSAVS